MTARVKLSQIFSPEEIKHLTFRSDWRGGWAVASTWGVIGGALWAVAWSSAHMPLWAQALVFVAALFVIAGRQLALAILTHDASHKTLFKSKWANDVLTDWLCARPIWNDLHKYRPYHFEHHQKTSTDDDPDLSLVAGFPTTKASLLRKFARDLSGVTGLKFVLGRVMMDAGLLKWTVANDITYLPQEGRRWWDYPVTFVRTALPMLITNGVLFGLLWLSGHPWLYGVWALAYVTPFPLLIRIRSLAEHACLETSLDMFKNTRSTKAGWLARAMVAPINVNYHIEHHVMPATTFFRLREMHELLRQRGLTPEPPTYWRVLKIVTTRSSSVAA
jgi:fatty acid desaturase